MIRRHIFKNKKNPTDANSFSVKETKKCIKTIASQAVCTRINERSPDTRDLSWWVSFEFHNYLNDAISQNHEQIYTALNYS